MMEIKITRYTITANIYNGSLMNGHTLIQFFKSISIDNIVSGDAFGDSMNFKRTSSIVCLTNI